MIYQSNFHFRLPPEQKAIKDRCFHPSGIFIEFPVKDVETSVPARFEKIVQMYPDRIAVETDNASVTYDALNRTANRLANLLLANMKKDNSPVAIILPKGVTQITAILAVLKTGKLFLLQDPNRTNNELANTLSTAQVDSIISNKDIKPRLSCLVAPDTRIVDVDGPFQDGNDENPIVPIDPEFGAYIKYTSGSTATAKGAIIPHRTILNTVMTTTNSMHFCSEDRLVHIHGNTISKWAYVHLLNGATLCPFEFNNEGMLRLPSWIERRRITIYRSFPGAFRIFVNSLTGEEQLSNLRIIRLGGEPLYRSDVELFKKHFPSDCVLINAYGTTETAELCSYYIDSKTVISGHQVPVGYPESGKEISLIDAAGQKLSPGETGEIVVKSRYLSSEYWQRDDENNIGSKPTDVKTDIKIYRTGDLGVLSADGCLTHLGRKDDRVKIRNFRVDVSEVEATLSNHPNVKQAIVITKQDPLGNTILVGYVVPKSKPTLSVMMLRKFLAETLPDYMIPAAFVELESFPLNATGKVDRRALPDCGKSRPVLDTTFIAPKTSLEHQMTGIWCEVFGLDVIGVDDNFFDLGGHSLAAMQIISKVNTLFSCEVSIRDLLNGCTVAEFSALVERLQGSARAELETGDI